MPVTGGVFISFRVLKVTVLSSKEVEFTIPEVGDNTPNMIPTGIYEVVLSPSAMGPTFGGIVATSYPNTIQIVAQPQVVPSKLSLGGVTLPSSITLPSTLAANLTRPFLPAIGNPNLFLKGLLRVLPGGAGAAAVNVANVAGGSSVHPYADGQNMFQAIKELIEYEDQDEESDFLYLAIWAFDEEMIWSDKGQRYREAKNDSAKNLLLELAQRMAKKRGYDKGCNIKVLVWNAPDDIELSPRRTYIRGLVAHEVPWGDISGVGESAIIRHLRRKYKNGARNADLRACIRAYKQNLSSSYNGIVYFPTGIQVLLRTHPDFLGSHHQKFIVRGGAFGGGYIGGLNFLKQYWDTNEHFFVDDRRDTSKGWFSGGSSRQGPLHDTGTILKGRILDRLLRWFEVFWSKALSDSSCGAFEEFVNLVDSCLVVEPITWDADSPMPMDTAKDMIVADMKKHFCKKSRIRDWDEITNVDYFDVNAHRLEIERDYLVKEDVDVYVSVPRYQPANSNIVVRDRKDIKEEYLRRIDACGRLGSFIYMENQYWCNYEIAERLFYAWRSAEAQSQGGGEGEELPFAYIVLPYNPETHWIDVLLKGNLAKDDILKREYQTIKWLEIKTARVIYEWQGNAWKPMYRVERSPLTDIGFEYSPDSLPETRSSEFEKLTFTLIKGYDMKGNPVRQKKIYVKNTLTRSDIMAFTIVSMHSSKDRREEFNKLSPHPGEARTAIHEFCKKYGIYVHSKCSLFREKGASGDVFWATIGSANLNYRSLEGDDGKRGLQDSEMNVFWSISGTEDNKILDFWANLWGEFGANSFDPFLFYDIAWRNLEQIQKHGEPIAPIVRLDVVDRYRRLSGD
jgi:phosphatidylserine/phosphatidylglycerophosphate/cardiolipin synthase-like enzyme